MTITRRIPILAVTSLLAAGCEMRADAQSRMPVRDSRTITRTLRFDGSSDRTVDVRTINGSIRVIADDINDVEIEARRTIRAERESDVETAEREVTLDFLDAQTRIGVAVRHSGQTCGESFQGRNDWRRRYHVEVEFTIRVPRRTGLRLCTINGGDVRVEGTDGDFDISNINGAIALEAIRGTGIAETINGDLTASFAEVPRGELRIKTLNGDIEATFPEELSADLSLKTRNGDLLTDFDVQVLPQRPERGERSNGLFVYRTDGSARVRVGSGGPEFRLETFNGDVRVLKERR